MTTFLLISAIATWGVLIFIILLLMGLIKRVNQLGGKPSKENLLAEAKQHRGEMAPPFTAEAPNGETVTLDSFAGQDVAFLFLSPTCQPCVEKIPMLNSYYPQAKAKGIEMVVVNVDPHITGAQFINDHNIEMPVITAPEISNPFSRRYYATATPSFCLVDADGQIRASGMINATHWPTQLALLRD
jgi:peroxiredoxin